MMKSQRWLFVSGFVFGNTGRPIKTYRSVSPRQGRRAMAVAVLMGVAAGLTGCGTLGGGGFGLSALTEAFKKKKPPIPGERIAVLKPENQVTIDATSARISLRIPPPQPNHNWSQPGGVPTNAFGHLAFSGTLRELWRKSAGSGSSSRGRLTGSPIVHNGKIYVLDTEAHVSAFSASSGAQLWKVNLTPEGEQPGEGFGGGLAAQGDTVYAATGFGTVVALAASTGAKKWTKVLGVPVRNSLTVANGKIFLLTTEGRFYCLDARNGDEVWSYRGLPEKATLMSNTSPAVFGKTVIAPFASGDVIAFDVANGQPKWSESLVRGRTRSPLNALNNPSRPVVADGVLYAIGHSGRMIATRVKDGQRLWQHNIAGVQMPWVAGNAVYIVDVTGQAMALSQKDGSVIWVAKLPKAKVWNGPVMAGGKLWLVSSKGLLVGLDPRTGVIKSKRDLGESIFIAPIVVAGRMYILTDDADLIVLN